MSLAPKTRAYLSLMTKLPTYMHGWPWGLEIRGETVVVKIGVGTPLEQFEIKERVSEFPSDALIGQLLLALPAYRAET